jgi:spore coat protein CotH
MNTNYYNYYNAFSTGCLKSVLSNYLRELDEIGSGWYPSTQARVDNISKRVDAIREIIKERAV